MQWHWNHFPKFVENIIMECDDTQIQANPIQYQFNEPEFIVYMYVYMNKWINKQTWFSLENKEFSTLVKSKVGSCLVFGF